MDDIDAIRRELAEFPVSANETEVEEKALFTPDEIGQQALHALGIEVTTPYVTYHDVLRAARLGAQMQHMYESTQVEIGEQ